MRRWLTPGAVVLLCLAGCTDRTAGPTPHAVSGKVLLPNGQPAYGAEISLIPKANEGKLAGAPGYAVLDKDGSFKLQSMGGEGIPAGHYAVVLNPNSTAVRSGGDKQLGRQSIPKKYWSEDTTDLKIEITGPKNDLVVQLK